MYQQASQEGGPQAGDAGAGADGAQDASQAPGAGADDDVVDADFEEVKDDKK